MLPWLRAINFLKLIQKHMVNPIWTQGRQSIQNIWWGGVGGGGGCRTIRLLSPPQTFFKCSPKLLEMQQLYEISYHHHQPLNFEPNLWHCWDWERKLMFKVGVENKVGLTNFLTLFLSNIGSFRWHFQNFLCSNIGLFRLHYMPFIDPTGTLTIAMDQ